MLDISDQIAMSNSVTCVDQTGTNSVTCVDQTGTLSGIRTLHLLLPRVHVEVFAQKERVGDLHLTVRSQTWTLIDQIVVILLRLYVDQTVLRRSSSSSETFLELISPKLLIRIFTAARLILPSRVLIVVHLLIRAGGK